MPYTLAELAHIIQGELYGDPDCVIESIASIKSAQPGQICFLEDKNHQAYLGKTQASAVILNPKFASECLTNHIIINHPQWAYAQIAVLFDPKPVYASGVDKTAIIDPSVQLGEEVYIGPYVVIGANTSIGTGTQIHAGSVIGPNCQLGTDCQIYPNVTIYHHCQIADKVILHSGVVIGADGFGLAQKDGQWRAVPQLGGVLIGSQVEIGANTTIDRGAIDNTIIHDGVKIDNQVQIAHNVIIGKNTVIAGCAGISGSTEIGANCMLGGGVAISGHLTITDGVILTGTTAVASSIATPGVYSSGMPASPYREWSRNTVRLRQLGNMAKQIKNLEKKLGELNHD